MAEIERTCEILPLVGRRRSQEDDVMFSVHCPTHGTEVLLSERRIEALVPVEAGQLVRWRCWCGTVGESLVARAPMVGRNRPAV
jgi:hypothetical protein